MPLPNPKKAPQRLGDVNRFPDILMIHVGFGNIGLEVKRGTILCAEFPFGVIAHRLQSKFVDGKTWQRLEMATELQIFMNNHADSGTLSSWT